MTSIQDYGYLRKKHTFESLSESLSSLESSHDKPLVNFYIIDFNVNFSRPFIAKYTEENLQKILKTVLETCIPLFDRPREQLLKVRSSNIYCDKFHIEYYNFY